MTDPTPRARPGRISRSLAVALSVVLITLGSVVAVVAANTNDGEATAEAATERMVSALTAGDLVGALEALPPGERRAIVPYATELVGHLQRLGLLPAVSLTSALGRPDGLRLEGFTASSVEIGRDTRRVTVTGGRLRGSLGALDLTPEVRSLVHDATGADVPGPGEAIDVDLAARPTSVLAIREGGGWHVSLYETLIDLVRDPAGPQPSWPGGPAPAGANTPGETVTDLWRAISDLDVGRAFGLVDPEELHALYEADPLFLPALRRDASRWVEDEGYGFPPPTVEVAVEGSGQERIVRITGFEAAWRDRDDTLRVLYDGRCLVWEHRRSGDDPALDPTLFTHCDGDVATAIDTGVTGERTHQLTVWTGLGRAFPTFVVRELNGRWYISPTRSALLTLNEILRGLTATQAGALLDRTGEVVHAFRPPA